MYLVKEPGNTGFYKIGMTGVHLANRMSGLQNGNPRYLIVVKKRLFDKGTLARCAEKNFIRYAAELGRTVHGEWIVADDTVAIGLFERACEGLPRIARRPKRRPIDKE